VQRRERKGADHGRTVSMAPEQVRRHSSRHAHAAALCCRQIHESTSGPLLWGAARHC
jgi:hypothetical protein